MENLLNYQKHKNQQPATQITREPFFELFASQLVLREAQAGNKDMAQRRLTALEEVELLEVTEEALALAEDLLSKGPLPRKAEEDAVHIAVAVVNGMDYLGRLPCLQQDP